MTLPDIFLAGLIGAFVLHGVGLCLLAIGYCYGQLRAYQDRRTARQFEAINVPTARVSARSINERYRDMVAGDEWRKEGRWD